MRFQRDLDNVKWIIKIMRNRRMKRETDMIVKKKGKGLRKSCQEKVEHKIREGHLFTHITGTP